MRSFKQCSLLVVVVCVTLLTTFRSAVAAPEPPAAPPATVAPAGTYVIYLPSMRQSPTAGTPNSPSNPPPVPPPTNTDGALFLESDKKTASPSIATDAQGGLHIAYEYYVPASEGADIVYSYCPPPATQCTTNSAWTHVSIAGPVEDVQLQLTPTGQPRILASHSYVGTYGGLFLSYIYAECDESCLTQANWRTVEVTSARQGYILDAREHPRRFFALDHQGRPRFVFSDNGSNITDSEQRYGGYLYSCDADCSVAENWAGTLFTTPDPNGSRRGEGIDSPVLKFTSDDQPRILAVYYPLSAESGFVTQIAYFACDNGCEDYTNWQRSALTPRGNGPEPAWDLELDANNNPRAVVYHEETKDDTSQRLFYYQCNGECNDASTWQPVNLELDQTIGKGANLALDAQGNPRIAHLVNAGTLAYSWCNSDCVQSATWLHAVADPIAQIDANDPVVIPTSCTTGLWTTYGPSFVLDPAGNPRIAYNASYHAQCRNLPGPPGTPPTSGFQEIAHRVRVFFTTQP